MALDDAAIARLLAGAKALLFPSLAEGFGFPLIEALACKVPVIASDLPVFREIGQGIADLLPPGDQQAWRDAIGDYCSPDSQRRSRQIARIEEFRAPDWPGHFKKVDRFLAGLPN
ncbi:MAG: glycosyltransferase [Erythrobacter sp.]